MFRKIFVLCWRVDENFCVQSDMSLLKTQYAFEAAYQLYIILRF